MTSGCPGGVLDSLVTRPHSAPPCGNAEWISEALGIYWDEFNKVDCEICEDPAMGMASSAGDNSGGFCCSCDLSQLTAMILQQQQQKCGGPSPVPLLAKPSVVPSRTCQQLPPPIAVPSAKCIQEIVAPQPVPSQKCMEPVSVPSTKCIQPVAPQQCPQPIQMPLQQCPSQAPIPIPSVRCQAQMPIPPQQCPQQIPVPIIPSQQCNQAQPAPIPSQHCPSQVQIPVPSQHCCQAPAPQPQVLGCYCAGNPGPPQQCPQPVPVQSQQCLQPVPVQSQQCAQPVALPIQSQSCSQAVISMSLPQFVAPPPMPNCVQYLPPMPVPQFPLPVDQASLSKCCNQPPSLHFQSALPSQSIVMSSVPGCYCATNPGPPAACPQQESKSVVTVAQNGGFGPTSSVSGRVSSNAFNLRDIGEAEIQELVSRIQASQAQNQVQNQGQTQAFQKCQQQMPGPVPSVHCPHQVSQQAAAPQPAPVASRQCPHHAPVSMPPANCPQPQPIPVPPQQCPLSSQIQQASQQMPIGGESIGHNLRDMGETNNQEIGGQYRASQAQSRVGAQKQCPQSAPVPMPPTNCPQPMPSPQQCPQPMVPTICPQAQPIPPPQQCPPGMQLSSQIQQVSSQMPIGGESIGHNLRDIGETNNQEIGGQFRASQAQSRAGAQTQCPQPAPVPMPPANCPQPIPTPQQCPPGMQLSSQIQQVSSQMPSGAESIGHNLRDIGETNTQELGGRSRASQAQSRVGAQTQCQPIPPPKVEPAPQCYQIQAQASQTQKPIFPAQSQASQAVNVSAPVAPAPSQKKMPEMPLCCQCSKPREPCSDGTCRR